MDCYVAFEIKVNGVKCLMVAVVCVLLCGFRSIVPLLLRRGQSKLLTKGDLRGGVVVVCREEVGFIGFSGRWGFSGGGGIY